MGYSTPDKQFIEIVKLSTSFLETMALLDMRPTGSNYKTIRKRIQELSLDVSHWVDGRAGRKGKTVPLDEILVKDSSYRHSSKLKNRLVREGLLEYRCYSCGIREWMEKPIVLRIDHITGDPKDNRIDNLRLLCPNCDSQTPTFGARNRKTRTVSSLDRAIKAGKKKLKYKKKFCEKCQRGISPTATLCKSCYGSDREDTKIEWPDVNQLVLRVKEKGYRATGEELGVSDNAVRKRIKNHS